MRAEAEEAANDIEASEAETAEMVSPEEEVVYEANAAMEFAAGEPEIVEYEE